MADTTNRIAGVAYLTVDGTPYRIAGDFEYSVSSVERKTLVGQSGVDGYSEMPMAGHLSGSLRDAGSLTVADFNAMTNNTVTVELANGKTVTARNAWTVDSQTVKTTDGTFDVRWDSASVTEN